MELEQLRETWRNIKTPKVDVNQLKNMTSEKSHPVLMGIRKQCIIELVGWAAFLIICFTGLDADQKPMLANAVLIVTVLIPMIYNVYGYQLSKQVIEGPNISSSLQNRIRSLTRFAIMSILLRVILILGVGYFFLSTIDITRGKFILIGLVGVFFLIPLCLLARIWFKRIGKLSKILILLKSNG